jgi:hypothetical protein
MHTREEEAEGHTCLRSCVRGSLDCLQRDMCPPTLSFPYENLATSCYANGVRDDLHATGICYIWRMKSPTGWPRGLFRCPFAHGERRISYRKYSKIRMIVDIEDIFRVREA